MATSASIDPPTPTSITYNPTSTKSQYPGLPGYNPDDLQPWFLRVEISMVTLSGVFVILRVVSRRIRGLPLWWDDWMIILSWLWFFTNFFLGWRMYHYGLGKHADLLPQENIFKIAKYLLISEVLYVFNLAWTKVGLLLMYYRIFHRPYFKKLVWLVGSVVMVWAVILTLLVIFMCIPIQKLWYPDIPGRCMNQFGTWVANAIMTILTDIIILILPIPEIWRLQLRRVEKIGLTLAFSLGLFVVFTSAYRTAVLFTYSPKDPSYTLGPTCAWGSIELSAGIVSACLPLMLPIVKELFNLLGIRRPLQAIIGSMSSNRSRSKEAAATSSSQRQNPNNTNTNTTARSGIEGGGGGTSTVGGKRISNCFYRLPDATDSGLGSLGGGSSGSAADSTAPIEVRLRPDLENCKYGVQSYGNTGPGGDDNSVDDISLHAIRVRRDFEQSTTSK